MPRLLETLLLCFSLTAGGIQPFEHLLPPGASCGFFCLACAVVIYKSVGGTTVCSKGAGILHTQKCGRPAAAVGEARQRYFNKQGTWKVRERKSDSVIGGNGY